MCSSHTKTRVVIPTSAAGEAALRAFAPRMGKHYKNGRNYDRGTGQHRDVSMLSPYLRCRLVLEQDAVETALQFHGAEVAEKFIQEVIWRGYFKGWMEHRPIIWDQYWEGLIDDLSALECDHDFHRRVEAAESGETGLDYFDNWAKELVETGYLHNHARMWFASIWVFTLGLPWRVGADFFYRHLLDGDAASNTLSWRWITGLHTRGKHYCAEAQNIIKFTGRRFTPDPTDLAIANHGLEATEPDGLPDVQALRFITPPQTNSPTALLITDEDCRIEDFELGALDIRTVATLKIAPLRSPRPVSKHVLRFEDGALADAAQRAGFSPITLQANSTDMLVKWAADAGATQIITPFVTRGPLNDFMDAAKPKLTDLGITLCEWQRDWDLAIWPHATAGFFKIKKKIPSILEQTRMT